MNEQKINANKNGKANSKIPTTLKDVLNIIKSKGLSGEITRGSIGSFTIKFGNIFLGLLSSIVLARFLGADEFGLYTYAFTIITILAIPTELGLPNLLIRFVAQYQVQESWDKLKGLLKLSNLAVLTLSLILIILSSIGAFYFHDKLESLDLSTFLWSLLILPLLALGILRSATLRGLGYIVLGLLPEKIIRQGLLITFVLFSYWWSFHYELTSSQVMFLHVIATGIAFILGAWWLFRKLPPEVKNKKAKYETKLWTKVVLPLLFAGSLQIIHNRVDIIMLGWFNSATEVGVYEVAVKGAMLVQFGLGALNMLLPTYFSRLYYQNEINKLQKLVSISVVISLFIALPVAGILAGFGSNILGVVFGPEYSIGGRTLAILCLAQLINVAAGSVAVLLNMAGYEKVVFVALIISVFMNISLNIVLIPIYGMEGAAIATVATFLILNSLLVIWCVKNLKIDTSIFGLLNYN